MYLTLQIGKRDEIIKKFNFYLLIARFFSDLFFAFHYKSLFPIISMFIEFYLKIECSFEHNRKPHQIRYKRNHGFQS